LNRISCKYTGWKICFKAYTSELNPSTPECVQKRSQKLRFDSCIAVTTVAYNILYGEDEIFYTHAYNLKIDNREH